MPYHHDAFISYSHAADGALAPALESGLEGLAKPTLRLRAMDAFRDQTGLAANPGLWAGIVEHLEGSGWFVLLASPASAASPWCVKEALWWLDNRGGDRMLVVLTEGEIAWDEGAGDFDWTRTTALAPALAGRFAGEPLYVDLRWAREVERPTLRDPRFRGAVLDLAAPVRGVPKDQLDGDDVRQLRRNRRLARGGVAVIALAAAVATWQAIAATHQRGIAIEQRDRALSRQLAAQASELRVREPVLSLLLAAQSLAASPSTEASTSLVRALAAAPFERIVDLPEALWSLAVTTDGRTAIVGDGGARTLRVDLATGAVDVLGTVTAGSPASKATLAVAVSPDGGTVASGGFDQAITLWRQGREAETIPPGARAHEGSILGLDFSPDGRRLASAGSDGRVLLHDLESGGIQVLEPGWTPEMSSVRFSADGWLLAAAGDGGALEVFALAGDPVPKLIGPPLPDSVVAVAFAGDNQLFAAYGNGWIYRIDLREGGTREELDASRYPLIDAMAVAREGSTVVSGHADGTVLRWTRDKARAWGAEPLHRHAAPVKGLSLVDGDRRVVSVGFDGRLFVSRPLGVPPLARELPARAVTADGETRPVGATDPTLVTSPDGATRYAIRGEDLVALDAATGTQKGAAYHLGSGLFPTIAVSPDGRQVAVVTGSQIDFAATGRREKGRRIVLLAADGLRPLADDLESIPDSGGDLADAPLFTPDGGLLALKVGRKLTIWDLLTLHRVDEAVAVPPDLRPGGFTGPGRELLLEPPPGWGTALALDLAPESWAREACRLAERALTRAEWSRYVSRELPYAPACDQGAFSRSPVPKG